MLTGLNFVLVHVPNVAEATTFYTEKFGLEIDTQQPDFVQFKPSAGNGAALALSQRENVNPGQEIELWWFVDDAEATLGTLKERGVEIADPLVDEPFGRTFSVKAPAGYKLYLLQLAQ